MPTNFTLLTLTTTFILLLIHSYTTTKLDIDAKLIIILNSLQRLCQLVLPVYWIMRKDNIQIFVAHRIQVWMNKYLPINVSDKLKKWMFPSSQGQSSLYWLYVCSKNIQKYEIEAIVNFNPIILDSFKEAYVQ